MSERARQAFEVYLELGDDRTLTKVAEALAADGKSISLPTLKRWSSAYHWKSTIKQQQQIVARAFCKKAGQAQVAHYLDDLSAVRELKRRFLQRVMLDPADSTLSKEERQLALAPSLRDYGFLIELEKQLIADETSSAEDAPAGPSATRLSSKELQELAAEDARKRYGLPDLRKIDAAESVGQKARDDREQDSSDSHKDSV